MMLHAWRVSRKKYTNEKAKSKRKEWKDKGLLVDGSVDVNMALFLKEYSSVITNSLCLMSVVELGPMIKGYTYPLKEIAMMRISEEANFSGCPVSIGQSDDR